MASLVWVKFSGALYWHISELSKSCKEWIPKWLCIHGYSSSSTSYIMQGDMMSFTVLNAARTLTWALKAGGQWRLHCKLLFAQYLLSAQLNGQGSGHFTVKRMCMCAISWKHLKKCPPASYVKCSTLGHSFPRQFYHQSHFKVTCWTRIVIVYNICIYIE